MYLYVRIDTFGISTKKRKKAPPGDDASTAEAAPGRVGRDEQVEHVEQTLHRMVELISS